MVVLLVGVDQLRRGHHNKQEGSWSVKQTISTRLAGCCMGGICLLLLAGCSSSSERRALEGTVMLDGDPLAEGSITLRPLLGTPGPTAGGKITKGKFSISTNQSTFVGTFRVEITALRKTGGKVMDPILDREIDQYEQYIPSRYNQQSELTREVTDTGPNRFEFKLTSP